MKKIIKPQWIFLLFAVFSLLIAGCEEGGGEKIEPGMQALETRNYDKAIEIFKSCVDNEGATGRLSSTCSFLLAKAYYEKGQYKEAINYFKQSNEVLKRDLSKERKMEFMHGANGTIYYWLGRAYYQDNQYKEAIWSFSEAAKMAVEDPREDFNKHFRGHDYPIVKFWRKYYVPLFPPKSNCYFWLGNAYYWDKQYEQAVNALQEAIKLDSKGPPDYFTVLAAAYREMRQYDKAIAAVDRAIEIQPTDFPYGVLRSIYDQQGKLDRAIIAGKKALELNPQNIQHYFSLSNLYLKIEDYPSNIAILQKAQEIAPDNYNILFALGESYARLGKFDEAITSLNKGVTMLTTPCLVTNFGLIAIQGDYPTVVGIVQGGDLNVGDKIIKINGESTRGADLNKVSQSLQEAKEGQVTLSLERKGIDKSMERKFNTKKEEVKKVQMVNKNTAGLLGKRSLIYALKGDFEKANKDAKMAYSLNPNEGMAKSAISFSFIISATALTQENKLEEAIKILATLQDSPFDRLLEALAYAKMGDLKKSAEIYASLPEEYLLAKDVFRQHFKNAVLESLAPYVERKREKVKALEAKGQFKEALKEYADLMKMADKKAEKELRGRVAVLLKGNPYLQELSEEARRHALRAEVLTKAGKFEEAIKEYQEAIRIAPFNPVLYKAIALNYAELKDYQKAIDSMNIYLELNPDAPDVRAAKDEIYKWEFMREKGGKL